MHLTAFAHAILQLHPTAARATFKVGAVLTPHYIADAHGAVLWYATSDRTGIFHAFATAADRLRYVRADPRLSRVDKLLIFDLGADSVGPAADANDSARSAGDSTVERVAPLSDDDGLRYAAERARRDDAAAYEDDRRSGRELRELRYEMRDARW